MSLCDPCKDGDHDTCIDVDPDVPIYFLASGKMQFTMPPGRMYRSCDCQHGGCVALPADQTPPEASENTLSDSQPG